jgi:cytochrome c biogenesis protein CcmG/thiol:disulfide interchange protein DsbE
MLAGFVVFLAACVQIPEGQGLRPEASRKLAPEFDLKGADGGRVKLANYQGKVVLVNFWATWCGPCKVEIPWFVEFQRTYKDRGFTVVGLSVDEDGWNAVKPYAERRKINYPTAIVNQQLLESYGGVSSLPTTFVVDQKGRIAAAHVGLVSKATYQKAIEELLGPAAVN